MSKEREKLKRKSKEGIRVLALCVFRRGEYVLVSEYKNNVNEQVYYRPIGGKVEFQERAYDAVCREVEEELGQPIKNLHYLKTFESIFTREELPFHEIILLFEADLVNEALYAPHTIIRGVEADGEPLTVVWKPLSAFNETTPLYPEGLLELLHSLS